MTLKPLRVYLEINGQATSSSKKSPVIRFEASQDSSMEPLRVFLEINGQSMSSPSECSIIRSEASQDSSIEPLRVYLEINGQSMSSPRESMIPSKPSVIRSEASQDSSIEPLRDNLEIDRQSMSPSKSSAIRSETPQDGSIDHKLVVGSPELNPKRCEICHGDSEGHNNRSCEEGQARLFTEAEQCTKCKGRGHVSEDCEAVIKPFAGTCHKCGNQGHTKQQCRQRKRKAKAEEKAFLMKHLLDWQSIIADMSARRSVAPSTDKMQQATDGAVSGDVDC